MDTYETISFPSGGSVRIHHLVSRDESDYDSLLSVARVFAEKGSQVMIAPKMTRPPLFDYAELYGALIGTPYEGKCPDLLIDGAWYELEGYTTTDAKRAFRNMLNRGLKQSDKIIIESPALPDAYMKRIIVQRIKCGHQISEVNVWDGYHISCLYKKV